MIVDQRYRLEELIGAGGFGEVWRATQEVEGQAVRPLALKLLGAPGAGGTTPGGGSGDGWLNEVRAIRDVTCDAVATIYDVGVSREPRVAFIAMELLAGGTLEDRLQAGPIYWRRALAIARPIATALASCHAVDVTHCDLKPPNVFLTAGGRVCVLDFGIAALGADQSATAAPAAELADGFATGAVDLDEVPGAVAPHQAFRLVGTPGYIAPEGYGGEAPGPAADVFALGVVLYQMISGRLPYDLPDDVPKPATATTREERDRYQTALNLATTRGDLVRLSSVADVPPAVSDLVMELLALDPAARPTSTLVAALDEAWARPWGMPDPPYVGLEAFGRERSGSIAGRDADIRDITGKLRDRRAIVLSGPSGCGKSSLAAAGVSARIDELLLDDRDGWQPVVVRPTSGSRAIATTDEAAGPAPAIGTVVVVDQLEEVLTLPDDQRASFCAALADLATGAAAVRVGDRILGPDHAVRVIATVRDDLFGRVAALPELDRVPEQNLYTVRGVEPNAIPRIVEGPAEAAGFALENAADAIAEARRVLAEDPSALPLVQFALTRWWEQRDHERALLPRAAWDTIGGIEGALADAAEQVYAGLTASQREHMRAVLIELFRADGTRVRVAEARVARDPESRGVVAQLIDRRLVRRQSDGDDKTLEVVHEALARRWHPLRAWLEETRAERELIQDAEYDADRWQRAGRPDDQLWRGGRLAQAVELGERVGAARDFISAAEHQAGRQRRTRRRITGAAFALLVAFVIGLVFAYLEANNARRTAEEQREAADQARTEAEAAATRADRARDVAERERANAARASTARDSAERELDAVETARRQADAERQRADDERDKAMDLAAKLTKQARELAIERDKAARAEAEAQVRAAEAQRLAEEARAARAEALQRARQVEAKQREIDRLRQKDPIGDLPQ